MNRIISPDIIALYYGILGEKRKIISAHTICYSFLGDIKFRIIYLDYGLYSNETKRIYLKLNR